MKFSSGSVARWVVVILGCKLLPQAPGILDKSLPHSRMRRVFEVRVFYTIRRAERLDNALNVGAWQPGGCARSALGEPWRDLPGERKLRLSHISEVAAEEDACFPCPPACIAPALKPVRGRELKTCRRVPPISRQWRMPSRRGSRWADGRDHPSLACSPARP